MVQRQPAGRRSERAQSMVEFAFSFVLLLILLAGLVDLGRAYFMFSALREAAEEGALFASLYADTSGLSAAVQTRVRGSLRDLSNAELTQVTAATTISGSACMGSPVRVVVTYDNFPFIFPFMETIVGTSVLDISAEITNTVLRPACN